MEQVFTIHCNHHKERSAEYLDKECCEFICHECYHVRDQFEKEGIIAIETVKHAIKKTMKLMNLRDYQRSMVNIQKDMTMTIDCILNSIMEDMEEISQKFDNKEAELSSVMIDAIKKNIVIAGFDKKELAIVGERIKAELISFNEKAIKATNEITKMGETQIIDSSDCKNEANVENKALIQLNLINGIQREDYKEIEKRKNPKIEVKPTNTKEQVIEELRKAYKPNEEIG